MASVSMFDVSSAPPVTVSPLPLRVKRSASHHAGALPVSLMTSSSSMTAFYDLTARDSEEGDEWIHRVLDISELESHGTRAAPWLMESGCVETDLREDPEALEEFVRHLGLRKFEIRRLVRALHLRAGTKSDLASTAGHRSPSCPHEVSKPLCVGDWKPHHRNNHA